MSTSKYIPYLYQLRTIKYFIRAFGVGIEQIRVLSSYIFKKLFPENADEKHLHSALNWLNQAQDICGGEGVASIYHLNTNWGDAYPETSGYILATYLVYAELYQKTEFIQKALKIGDWEISIQAENGGVFSNMEFKETRVFNTGQVILGWCALYEYTNNFKYLKAAIFAADYLVEIQESDGTWVRDTYCGARTYHTGVDWALLRVARLSGNKNYINAAYKNLKWAVDQQHQNGWFENCGFNNDNPNMHVIVYTLRGLLECYLLGFEELEDLKLFNVVIKATDSLCKAIELTTVDNIVGMVQTSFNSKWESDDKDSCLTGNAQFACLLYLLSYQTNNLYYKNMADIIISATKRTQLLETNILPIRGAIPGSYPIFHGYANNSYPNWAAKFFADALMMKIDFKKKVSVPA